MVLSSLPAAADLRRVAFAKESVYKTAPTGVYTVLPITGDSLQLEKGYVDSPTLAAGRRAQGQTQTRQSTSGGFNFAVRPFAYDDLLLGALWSSGWTKPSVSFAGGDVAACTITVASSNFAFASSAQFGAFAAGDVISVTAADNFAHWGVYRVVSSPSPTTSAFQAVKMDGTAPVANGGAEALRIVKVGEYGTFTLTAGGGGATATIDIGDADGAASASTQGWVKLGGFATSTNNGVWKVTNVATTTLTLARPDGGVGFVTEASVATAFWTNAEFATDGSTQSPFSVELRDDLATDIWQLWTGQVPETYSLTATVGQPVTGSITFLGSNMQTGTADVATGYNAIPQTNELRAQDVVVWGNAAGIAAQSASWQIANNVRTIEEIGSFGASQITPGTFQLTGTIQAYFEDKTQLDRYIADQTIPLEQVWTNSQGIGYMLRCPRVKYSSVTANATGRNTDVLCQIQWASEESVSAGYQARLFRFA